jgi:ABC-type transporter Mla subunit MlaD
MVIIDELGIATAARGEDLNQILLRANPTLSRARQTIGILARQRAELQTIVDATDRIALEGANHTGDLKRFLEEASVLTSLTAAHSDSLSRAIARLPGLLAATKPSLQQLDVVAREGTPLLGQIDVAVPSLNRLAGDLKPFVKAANPGLARLDTALGKAIPAIRDSTPLVRALRSYSDRSRSSTKLMRRLLENLQRHGFFENFVSIAYYIAASLSRFDASSHLLSLLLVGAQNGSCGNYATTPAPGCSAHYGSQPSYKPSAGDLQALATYLVK